ncbi:MAG: sigma-70 family RNA polymerase sigma factor [Deltaproteobacteria bacterium]|nr:sigma-70 family RNA polymerase sigma factor [Deltaproteobacteria bacterium]
MTGELGQSMEGTSVIAVTPEDLVAELEATFAAWAQRAYWIALDISGEPEEARDAVQDAWVLARSSLPRFRHDAAMHTWLLRIVVNRALKALRRRRIRVRLSHLLPGVVAPPVSTSPGPEELLQMAEQAARVRTALAGLAAQQRAAFVLRHVHGLSVPEVAQTLGVSPGTTKTHLLRAVKRLRSTLEESP